MQHVSDTFRFLYQLNILLHHNIPLTDSMTILANMHSESKKVVKCKKIAEHILDSLKKGYGFSRSIFLCPYVSLSESNIRLLEAAEQSACITDSIAFLCLQFKRAVQIRKDIRSVVLYPLLVITMALFGTLFLLYWKSQFLTSISNKEAVSVVIRAASVLILLLLLLALYVQSALKEPTLFQLYHTLGFLQGAGFPFCTSLELFMGNASCSFVNASVFQAYNEIRKGCLVSTAFKRCHLVDDHEAVLLEIGEKSGNITMSCMHIAEKIMATHEDKRAICLRLLEPILLFIVGIYIIILLNGIVVPYITDFGGAL